MTTCKRCGGVLTPGAAGCTGCNRRVPSELSVRPRQPLAQQRQRAVVTRQPALALATRPIAGAPNQTLPPPTEWVPPPEEVVEITAVAAPPPPPPPPAYTPSVDRAPPPVFHAPPPTARRERSSGGKMFRPVVWAFGVFVILAVVGAIENAVNTSPSPDIKVSIPSIQFTPPSFVPPKAPAHGVHVDAMTDLISLVAANEIYRAEHGSYSNKVGAIATGQFHVNPQGDYRIGVGGGGYCMVGRESNTAWRLYDANNPTSIAQTYRDEATAKRACSLPVHWG